MPAHRALYIFNHFEYDSDTLKQEYDRDVANGTPINVPPNYYPDDDPARPPLNRWRSHAHLLYGNWINEIYQSTPYDIAGNWPLSLVLSAVVLGGCAAAVDRRATAREAAAEAAFPPTGQFIEVNGLTRPCRCLGQRSRRGPDPRRQRQHARLHLRSGAAPRRPLPRHRL